MTMTSEPEVADPSPGERRRRAPAKPGQRDHGELSQHRAGPDAKRHGEDVTALLKAERDAAQRELEQAQRNRAQAEREIERWDTQVAAYDEMLGAVERAQPK